METLIQPRTPTPKPATPPRTLRSTRRIVKDIRSCHIHLSPTIQRHLKGSLYLAEELAITTTQLHQEQTKRQKPRYQKRSKKHVKMPDILYTRDVKDHIKAKEKERINKMFKNHKKKWKQQAISKILGQHLTRACSRSPSPIAFEVP
jgi:hypothetical protein